MPTTIKKTEKKGLKRLEKRVSSGKLSKKHINNRGYNKYLKLIGDITIIIDYEKYNADSVWDGLKGYITNTKLTKKQVVGNYQQLWHIEKAFRISKTDLRIRPVYHRIKHRIEAHICICFAAYAVYKEFERTLEKNNIAMSPEKAINEKKEIRQLQYKLPKSGQVKTKLLRLTDSQAQLMDMRFLKWVLQCTKQDVIHPGDQPVIAFHTFLVFLRIRETNSPSFTGLIVCPEIFRKHIPVFIPCGLRNRYLSIFVKIFIAGVVDELPRIPILAMRSLKAD